MIKRAKLRINKPFYGAGSETQYGWVKDGYHIFGIGIKFELLDLYDSFDIEMDDNVYRISATKAKEFVEKYKSIYKVRKYNTKLAVISKSAFNNITVRSH